jgi:outer membrane protein assembly factor BamA
VQAVQRGLRIVQRYAPAAIPALLALAAAPPAGAADWSLAPQFALGGEYNTNAYLEYQDAAHRSGGTLDVTLPLAAKTERTDFALALGGHLRRYDNDPNANRDDETLNLNVGQTRERSGWKASAGWTRDTTLSSELGTTGITVGNQRHNRYQASIAPQIQLSARSLFVFGVSGELNRYDNATTTGLVDYGYASVYATYARQTTEITSVGLGFMAGGLSVPDRHDSESVNGVLRLTLQHQFSERLGLEAYAGPSFARTRTLERWGAAGMLALKYGGQRTDFSLSAEHALAPAGLGALTVHDGVALGMGNRLTEKLSLGTTVGYQRSSDALYAAGTQRRTTSYWRAAESLRWQWTETFSVALSAGVTRQRSSVETDHASQFIGGLRFGWNPRSPF